MDTKIGCFMKPEVAMQRRRFSREFKLEAVTAAFFAREAT